MAQENRQPAQQPEVSINELMRVRREKLAELQSSGNDPFVQTS